MDAQNIENLLLQVNAINKKYHEIAKITGENFNIFRILKVEAREVKLHSAFIAELLNPIGSHAMGNLFAIDFLKILSEKWKLKNGSEAKIPFDFFAENIRSVEIEKWINYKTDTDGGYIDILLTDDKNNHIIIENKIYAGDQDNQLLRYHNFDSSSPIIYLTLYGSIPSDYSTTQNESVLKQLICISYKDDILNWLVECKKHTVDHPILRETLTQYINNIKYLTNQTMSNQESTEIIDIIISNQLNINNAKEIRRCLNELEYTAENNLYLIFKRLEEITEESNKKGIIINKVSIHKWRDSKDDSSEVCIFIENENLGNIQFEIHGYYSWDNFNFEWHIGVQHAPNNSVKSEIEGFYYKKLEILHSSQKYKFRDNLKLIINEYIEIKDKLIASLDNDIDFLKGKFIC
jgi:hypothetical protein